MGIFGKVSRHSLFGLFPLHSLVHSIYIHISECVYMYVCMHVYVYIYTHAHTHTYVFHLHDNREVDLKEEDVVLLLALS